MSVLKNIIFTIQTLKGVAESVKIHPSVFKAMELEAADVFIYPRSGRVTICGVPVYVTRTVKDWEVSSMNMEITVFNWAFGQGLQVLSYNELRDEWRLNDGEIYTTDCILREVEKNDHRNSIQGHR
jgi:hypothetical protein